MNRKNVISAIAGVLIGIFICISAQAIIKQVSKPTLYNSDGTINYEVMQEIGNEKLENDPTGLEWLQFVTEVAESKEKK